MKIWIPSDGIFRGNTTSRMDTLGTDTPTTSAAATGNQETPAVALKGSVFTLPILKLGCTELPKIEAELQSHLTTALNFFKDAPVVIDLSLVQNLAPELNFQQLKQLLTKQKLVPVGIQNGSTKQVEAAKAAGFAVVTGQTIDRFIEHARSSQGKSAADVVADDNSVPSGSPVSTVFVTDTTNQVICQPVRSGQRVYAKGGDLIVLAAVNAGAEVMADGNLHIYAPLRGRALAGVDGSLGARIFCHSMEAELVAVAGNYRVFEDKMPSTIYKKSVQIYLEGEQLHIEPLS